VRVEVLGADGRPKVLSNPVTFVRAVPDGGIEPARLGIDLGGVVSEDGSGFRLLEARVSREGDTTVVRLAGRGADGRLDLRVEGAERGSFSVELEDLAGRKVVAGNRIELSGLTGEGAIRIIRKE
jgi:hypothetical protein